MSRQSESPGFLLWHATLRWQRGIAAALQPLGLTHAQFVLLAVAWWANAHGESPTQLALAAQAGTDVNMTSQVVRALERKALMRREPDPADARAKRLHVTKAGAALAERAVSVVEAVDEEFFSGVPRADTLGILKKLAKR